VDTVNQPMYRRLSGDEAGERRRVQAVLERRFDRRPLAAHPSSSLALAR